jgi:hypothetical protein
MGISSTGKTMHLWQRDRTKIVREVGHARPMSYAPDAIAPLEPVEVPADGELVSGSPVVVHPVIACPMAFGHCSIFVHLDKWVRDVMMSRHPRSDVCHNPWDKFGRWPLKDSMVIGAIGMKACRKPRGVESVD